MVSVTHWWYNTETGQLTRSNILTQTLQSVGSLFGLSAGWHELHIPGSDSASQAIAEAKKEFPSGATPTTAGITPQRVLGVAANESGVTGALDFLKQPALWTRVGEILGGVILLYVGLKAITTPQGQQVSVQGPRSVYKNAKYVLKG